MKSVSENLFQRGKLKTFYVRRRIPTSLLSYFDGRKEIVRSLKTSDKSKALKLARIAHVEIDEKFAQYTKFLRDSENQSPIEHKKSLTDGEVQNFINFYLQQAVCTDEYVRSQGMSDEEYDELTTYLIENREFFGRLLAKGQVQPLLNSMRVYFDLCQMQVSLNDEEQQRIGYQFLKAVVQGFDMRLERHCGKVLGLSPEIVSAIHPNLSKKSKIEWSAVFDVWKFYVEDRPKSTVIAYMTPWAQLQSYAKSSSISAPDELEPKHISGFVESMKKSGLAITTINARLTKLKEIFKIAAGKEILTTNPALNTLGFKESSKQKGQRRRLAFTREDVQLIFSSDFFTTNKRSAGQAGEASYWLPIIMYYTGARPEEIAGLQVSDIKQHETLSWYFDISDLPDSEDADLFDRQVLNSKIAVERRRLKTLASRRLIPISNELIGLGLLQYVSAVMKHGHTALFPTLKRDTHGKLCGALSKWFGREKNRLGFKSSKKVLYSLRHTMKNLMEEAQIPTKYLQRILGHASGDGAITDGYGDDVPFSVIYEYFNKIEFPPIPAKPWEPGDKFRDK